MPDHEWSIRSTATRLRRSFRESGPMLSAVTVASVAAAISAIGLLTFHSRSSESEMARGLAAEPPYPTAPARDHERTLTLGARLDGARRLLCEVEAVREHGTDAVSIVDAVVSHLPNGTRLQEVSYGDGTVSISGSADSADAVTTFASRLRGLVGALQDVEISTNRTIGRTPGRRGRRDTERVIHAFDIRARFSRGSASESLESAGGDCERQVSNPVLVAECADAERRVAAALDSLPFVVERGIHLDELRRLVATSGVHLEHLSAASRSTRVVSCDGERRELVAQPFEIRVLASYRAFRRLLGELTCVGPSVRIDSLVASSLATDGRFPLDGRLRVTFFQQGHLEDRRPYEETPR